MTTLVSSTIAVCFLSLSPSCIKALHSIWGWVGGGITIFLGGIRIDSYFFSPFLILILIFLFCVCVLGGWGGGGVGASLIYRSTN